MMKIDSISNEKIKKLAKLKDSKYLKKDKYYLIEGENIIKEAIHKNKLVTLFILEEKAEKFSYLFSFKNTILVNKKVLNKLSSMKTPKGLVGVCRKEENNNIKGEKIIVLDNLNDPSNVGTIIRSALSFEFDSLVLCGGINLYNLKLISAAQGSHFSLNIVCLNLKDTLTFLKENKFEILTTSLKKESVLYKNIEKKKKIALIVGNEKKGVSLLSEKESDYLIKINISPKVDSLNVGVASSILMEYFK